jgi:hypothetical protein
MIISIIWWKWETPSCASDSCWLTCMF